MRSIEFLRFDFEVDSDRHFNIGFKILSHDFTSLFSRPIKVVELFAILSLLSNRIFPYSSSSDADVQLDLSISSSNDFLFFVKTKNMLSIIPKEVIASFKNIGNLLNLGTSITGANANGNENNIM